MLKIDLQEHDQGPHWLSGPAKELAARVAARVTAKLRDKYRNFGKKKKDADADEKDWDEADHPRDEHGRFGSGGSDSGEGAARSRAGRNNAGSVMLDDNLVKVNLVANGEPPTFINPVGMHEWQDTWEPEHIKNNVRIITKDLEDSQLRSERQRKEFIQANAGVEANISKLKNKTGKLQNELNELWEKDVALPPNSPEQIANFKAMSAKADEHAAAVNKELKAVYAARDKARDAYTKAARSPVSAPLKIQADIYDGNENAVSQTTLAMKFLQGTIQSSSSDIESRSHGQFNIPITMIPKDAEQRAYHNSGRVAITNNTEAATIVHEIGHAIEWRYPGVATAACAFLMKRVGDEPLVDMRGQFPNHGYKEGEVGRKDEFLKAMANGEESHAYYTGKHYEHGSTEIMSMGLENLYRDPANFAKRDPDYFNFVSAVMRGDIR